MEIKVLGTGCPNCTALYKTVERAISELTLESTLLKEQDILKIMEYKVMGLPALVVNEKVVSVGKVLNLNEAKQILIQQGEE
ncbi:thioredoxin family protein [Butyricimonas hominis]|uniref:thioredoxin family protein n=1 Tax=Butyricimonas hominis TaxID=2763032 RepID=UPI00351233C4